MPDEAVAVFTARSTQRILREGGSQAWALDPNRARKCRYLVCVQNQHNPDRDFSDATEAHGAVFLVGKISDVIPAPEDPDGGRWQIRISGYSTHIVMNAWKGWRNPVRYTTLKEMGVELEKQTFHSVAQAQQVKVITYDNRPWWAYTKAEQKKQIENAVERYLSENAELTNRQKMLLRDALGHTYRGLLGPAVQDMYELSLPESAWSSSARVEPPMVDGVSHETLRRALTTLRASSVQSPPVFR